jgi:acyl-coenzyme A thioesterase PaaI-like protein
MAGMTATAADIPDGFEPQSRPSPLTDPWEPIYSKQTPDAIILGLRLATPHTNARGFVHGGLIAALTDKAMATAAATRCAAPIRW